MYNSEKKITLARCKQLQFCLFVSTTEQKIQIKKLVIVTSYLTILTLFLTIAISYLTRLIFFSDLRVSLTILTSDFFLRLYLAILYPYLEIQFYKKCNYHYH